MRESFQRLLTMSAPEARSLNAQAALGVVRQPERSQFSHLLRHFLERFFNHETASQDGDAKARLILIAFTVGLPGAVVALYLWPDYHSFIPYMRDDHIIWVAGPPPYWVQVNEHFFFVMYSFVVLGIATVFEWDLFFPDLLDLLVLNALPIPDRRLFYARVAAIAILIAGFLFDANVLASVVLPEAVEPPNLPRFLAAHVLAVAASGIFAAAFVLALQGLSLAVLGERLFRKLAFVMQGFGIAALLLLLFLFPALSNVTPEILKSGRIYALGFPPFWFLGIYQRLMEGPAAMPIFGKLAQIGCAALLGTVGVAALAYPLAYVRRVRQLVVGAPAGGTHSRLVHGGSRIIHATLARRPVCRAVFHFISQTLLRVPRYRIYLVVYGGVGLSVVAATVIRLTVVNEQVRMTVSPDGIRAATGMIVFWVIVGLRTAFVSPGNQQGSWVFRLVHGRPPQFRTAVQQLLAAKVWTLMCAGLVTGCALLLFHAIAPRELLSWQSTAAQILVAGGMCLLFTDVFFLNVTTVAFTGQPAREQPNLAINLMKYLAFFPAAAALPMFAEPWIEMSVEHFAAAIAAIAAAHLLLRTRHRGLVKEYCNLIDLEEGEEEFPMKLGLRY